MTNGPTPTPPPRNEGEYARKLALAILSTLEKKGVLSALDVDTILHVAHRSAAAQEPENAAAPAAPTPPPKPRVTMTPGTTGPAALGTRWVKAPAADKGADTAPAAITDTAPAPAPSSGLIIPAPSETEAVPTEAPALASKERGEPSAPPVVIDFTLD